VIIRRSVGRESLEETARHRIAGPLAGLAVTVLVDERVCVEPSAVE